MQKPLTSPKIREMLDETTIRNAVAGDLDALKKVIDYYESYIDKYALRRKSDGFGNVWNEIDPDVKTSLQLSLTVAIMKFKFR